MDPVPVLGAIIVVAVVAGLIHRAVSSRVAQTLAGPSSEMPTSPGLPMGAVVGSGGGGGMDKEQLLVTGTEGHARILSATPTGETDAEGKRVFDLLFEVRIEGVPTFQAPARAGVPAERVERMVAGATLAVRADPGNPQVMAVDWEHSE